MHGYVSTDLTCLFSFLIFFLSPLIMIRRVQTGGSSPRKTRMTGVVSHNVRLRASHDGNAVEQVSVNVFFNLTFFYNMMSLEITGLDNHSHGLDIIQEHAS